MIHQVFTVRDAKAEAFLQPFFSPTLGVAMRSVAEAVNNLEHQFNRYAEDYALFHLGTFDDASATFALEAQPRHITGLLQLLNPVTPPPLLEAMERK